LSEAGHTVEALTEAQVAVKLQPDDAQTYAALGAIYLRTNDGAGALAAFERALQCPGVEDDRLPSGDWIIRWPVSAPAMAPSPQEFSQPSQRKIMESGRKRYVK
jgi:hypothetical protein